MEWVLRNKLLPVNSFAKDLFERLCDDSNIKPSLRQTDPSRDEDVTLSKCVPPFLVSIPL